MGWVISKDGTKIAFEQAGSGPPLVLVHGTTGSSARWRRVLPGLATTFTVYTLDRRGRGGSGDAADYKIDREYEDVAAVVDSLEEPANLLGHSFGGICALEAARLTDNVKRLILYEPPVAVRNTPAAREGYQRLERLLASGDREGALIVFLQDNVGVPERVLKAMRASPSWEARIATARTLPREVRAVTEYELPVQSLAELEIPVLLFLGGDSPPLFVESTRMIHAALPNCEVVELPGQQHAAMSTAPGLFTNAVLQFLQAE